MAKIVFVGLLQLGFCVHRPTHGLLRLLHKIDPHDVGGATYLVTFGMFLVTFGNILGDFWQSLGDFWQSFGRLL